MRKKLLILALLLITGLLPASSYTIKLKNKGDLQNGSLRVPPTALISADYDEGEIAINISNFTGSAQVHLYDSNGNVVGNDSAEFMYDGTLTIEVGDLPNGNYTLNVVLGDITFYGEFQVPS